METRRRIRLEVRADYETYLERFNQETDPDEQEKLRKVVNLFAQILTKSLPFEQ